MTDPEDMSQAERVGKGIEQIGCMLMLVGFLGLAVIAIAVAVWQAVFG